MCAGLTAPAVGDGHAGAVILRAVTPDDFAVLAAMHRDAELQALLLAAPEAADDAAAQAWIARRCEEADGGFRVFADAGSARALGYVHISQVHRRNRYGHGVVALAREARGRGLGRAALGLLVAYAAQDLGLFKMLADVRADNEPALKISQAAGFRVVGTLLAHARAGDATHDVILLERLLGEARP